MKSSAKLRVAEPGHTCDIMRCQGIVANEKPSLTMGALVGSSTLSDVLYPLPVPSSCGTEGVPCTICTLAGVLWPCLPNRADSR
eukprot:5073726-Alexandrium_andersonii.AAC.1